MKLPGEKAGETPAFSFSLVGEAQEEWWRRRATTKQ
jgi:hypothetical protein